MTARKYNPGFLTTDELIANFCVRTAEYESLIEALRECSGNANIHQIVIGPRGSGKTTLLLRVAAEVPRDADLSKHFFPIVFAEESYEVSTAGEFWLECVSRLADQVPHRNGDVNFHRTFEELRTISDDRTLEHRCLGVLQDFADRKGKRLILVVENLNMMFRDISDNDTGWRLRQVLQTEPRIVLLASATSRFDQMDDPREALYEIFRVIRLDPLDMEDCANLWRTVSGQSRPPQTIQALRILTGGNPRLLTIVARFGANLSFHELLADLLNLVDDHTEYFKSHLDALPAQERKVYLALADLWKPANAREIADRARLGTSQCSAQLARLVDKGTVEVSGGSPRRKLYYLTERLYNIYYLMRRARGSAPLVDALIRFMESYYSTDEMREFFTRMAREALECDRGTLVLYRLALERLIELPSLKVHRNELRLLVSPDFTYAHSEFSKGSSASSVMTDLSGKALVLAEDGRLLDAVKVWDEIVQRFGKSETTSDREEISLVLYNKGRALCLLGRAEEALEIWDDIVQRFGENSEKDFHLVVASALASKGEVLNQLGRHKEALVIWEEVRRRCRMSRAPAFETLMSDALGQMSVTLNALNLRREALEICDEVLERFIKSGSRDISAGVGLAMFMRGEALRALNRFEEAIEAWNAVAEQFRKDKSEELSEVARLAIVNIGEILFESGRLEEALTMFDRVVQSYNTSDERIHLDLMARCLVNRGNVLAGLKQETEALSSWEGAIKVWNDVTHQLESGEEPYGYDGGNPMVAQMAARALVSKAALLITLDRTEEGLAAWDDIVRRFETSDVPALRDIAESALCERAQHELTKGLARNAIEFLDRALLTSHVGNPDTRSRGHLIRARAYSAEGDDEECIGDVEMALSILPELSTLPREALVALADLSAGIGPEKMCDLIGSSPAGDLLLPLRTALERELGMEPRVAREVEEIAEDIRRELLGKTSERAEQRMG